MALLTYENILTNIKSKKFDLIYVLQGDEGYYIDKIINALEENVLKEEEKAFNQTIIYGKDATAMSVSMAAKRYPMPPAEFQLIIVKEAQAMKDIEELESYFDKPSKNTILCIGLKGKKLDGRKKLAKLVKKYCLFNADPIKEYQLPAWIETYIRSKGKNIDNNANMMIAEYLGNDLSKIANEVDKMLINVGETAVINLKLIEENIGISKEYNVFELNNAVGSKNFNKAIQIAHYFASDKKKNPLVLSIANLNTFFTKVYLYLSHKDKNPYELTNLLGLRGEFALKEYRIAVQHYTQPKVEEIFGLLKYYDLRGKGVDSSAEDEGALLIELLVKIMK